MSLQDILDAATKTGQQRALFAPSDPISIRGRVKIIAPRAQKPFGIIQSADDTEYIFYPQKCVLENGDVGGFRNLKVNDNVTFRPCVINERNRAERVQRIKRDFMAFPPPIIHQGVVVDLPDTETEIVETYDGRAITLKRDPRIANVRHRERAPFDVDPLRLMPFQTMSEIGEYVTITQRTTTILKPVSC